ncbi:MAG: twitching motility protein PilT [Lachnospiraceae bacterium]|nr:twitching motility protein PilT [Lachnospiraceae bacterium]
MVSLITGEKGKGKTRILIDTANEKVKEAKGCVVYLDHSMRHMYELNNKIRLICTKDFPIATADEMLGFVMGIISQNRDIEQMYIDGLLKIPGIEKEDVAPVCHKIMKICDEYSIDMTVTLSVDKADLDADLQALVNTAL